MKSIFIPYNIPSSKNSKIATSKGVFHSKAVGKFLRDIGIMNYSVTKRTVQFYKTKPCLFPHKELKELFKDAKYPVEVGVHFVRKTKADFDFHNACQIIFDLLVAFEIIPDDSMKYVVPCAFQYNEQWYTIDKEKPGAYITLQ